MHLPDVCSGDAFFVGEEDSKTGVLLEDDHVTTIQWIELDSPAAPAAQSEPAQPCIVVALLIGCESGLIRLVICGFAALHALLQARARWRCCVL
jgi:hypothetical protein